MQVHINAIGLSFEKDEVHLSEVQLFEKLAEEGEVAVARPRGIPLLAWEDLERNEADPDHSAHISTQLP